MDDRYLFRGKQIGFPSEWLYGALYQFGTTTSIVHGYELDGQYNTHIVPVFPETVGQCTGLRDRNGELIWEGDIIKTHYANAPKADHVETVVFRNGKFMAECKIGDAGKSWALLADGVPHLIQDKSVYMESCESVGNVHDNQD